MWLLFLRILLLTCPVELYETKKIQPTTVFYNVALSATNQKSGGKLRKLLSRPRGIKNHIFVSWQENRQFWRNTRYLKSICQVVVLYHKVLLNKKMVVGRIEKCSFYDLKVNLICSSNKNTIFFRKQFQYALSERVTISNSSEKGVGT